MLLAQGLFLCSIFGSVGSVVWFIVSQIMDNDGRRISDRLNDKGRRSREQASDDALRKGSLLKRLGAIAAQPFAAEGGSDRVTGMRAKLATAGVYDPSAIRSLVGFKFIALIVGLWVLFANSNKKEQTP